MNCDKPRDVMVLEWAKGGSLFDLLTKNNYKLNWELQ